ncbi:MAG: helix-turn-helix domain-containing protein [Rhodospirillales bacterium]|nr:helix-turn-helix domain-containing protein [Rhodospirillales bacterium]
MKKKRIPKGTPNLIDKFVGSRVRARRVGLRQSQTNLGQAIGVTFQQIQKYENGSNRIGASNLFKIANALGVEVSFFFEGMPDDVAKLGLVPRGQGLAEPQTADFEHDPMSSRESIELMHNYFRIEDTMVRKRLFQFVKSLADANG